MTRPTPIGAPLQLAPHSNWRPTSIGAAAWQHRCVDLLAHLDAIEADLSALRAAAERAAATLDYPGVTGHAAELVHDLRTALSAPSDASAAYQRRVRGEALEEAARRCDGLAVSVRGTPEEAHGDAEETAEWLAMDIRALKETP